MMTQSAQRWFILATTLLPPAAVAAAVVALGDAIVSPAALIAFAVTYFLTGFGLYAGYHRLLTHRAFKTSKPLRLAITTLGVMGGEGPPIPWVAQHRRHHAVSDTEEDPHSPHLHGDGLRGALRGLWWAHLGWLLDPKLDSEPMRYAPDLVREREMRWISRNFLPIMLAGLVLPGLVVLAITRDPREGLLALVWAGPLRMFLQLHVTYSVNSIAHFFGRQRFRTGDHSRNVAWLALPALGEGWHHNHHAFPSAASFRFRWWELDAVGATIGLLERLGLVWDAYRPTPAEQRARETAGPSRRVAPPGTRPAERT